MSLLSDILSKVKHSEKRKNVVPGLKKTSPFSKKKSKKKYLVLFFSLTGCIFFSLIIVFAGDYLNTKPKKTTVHLPKKKAALPMKEKTKNNLTSVKQTVPQKKQSSLPKKITAAAIVPKEITPQQEQISATREHSPAKRKKKKEKTSKIETVRAKREEDTTQVETNDTPVEIRRKETPSSEPVTTDRYLYRANSYEEKKLYGQSISEYKKIISIEPNNYQVMTKIAALLIQLNLEKEALPYLKNVLHLQENYLPALINMGIVYARMDDFSAAERILLQATSQDKTDKYTLFNLALVYEKQQQFKKAAHYYHILDTLGDESGKQGLLRVTK